MKSVLRKSSLALALAGVSTLALAQYPALPESISGAGTGALVGDTLYVGLGQGTNLFYSLNLKDKNAKWEAVPAFPGGSRNQASAAGVDGKLYIFGGFRNTELADNQIAKDAYSYDPQTKSWSKLNTRAPLAAAGTSTTVVDGKIYFFGGVNQNIWDGLFQDVKAAGKDAGAVFDKYFAMSAEDFFFNPIVSSYDPKTNHWANQGHFPYGGRAGAGFVYDGKNFIVINGERKAGLRTDSTSRGTLVTDGIAWEEIGKLPAPKGEDTQEGIAAGMAGFSHGTLLVTGGANFPGVAKNYQNGVYDHRKTGSAKAFRSDIYALDAGKGTWKHVGNLPYGIAEAVSVSYGNKVIVVGGKTTGNKPLTSVHTLEYQKGKVVVK